MELRTLRYFLAVCEHGTMSRAAEALHVTQPALSRQIAALERELGTPLLERHSRSVTPTEKGLYLRRRAQEIVGTADPDHLAFLDPAMIDRPAAGIAQSVQCRRHVAGRKAIGRDQRCVEHPKLRSC